MAYSHESAENDVRCKTHHTLLQRKDTIYSISEVSAWPAAYATPAAAYAPAPAYGYAPGPAYNPDEVRTVFVTGFPADVKERELNNLLRFVHGWGIWHLALSAHPQISKWMCMTWNT